MVSSQKFLYRKVNGVKIVPVRPLCCTACKSPKPFIAQVVFAISGQAFSMSLKVKTSLFLLKASSDNFTSCLTILAQGSGRSFRLLMVLSRERYRPALESHQQTLRQLK